MFAMCKCCRAMQWDGATELVLALCCWHTVLFFGEGVMNPDQAPLFIISAVIEAGGSLVGHHTTWREASLLGRHNDISFLHAIMHCWLLLQVKVLCRYLLQVLCWISLSIKSFVKVNWVWHPGLCCQSFVLCCVAKIQANMSTFVWKTLQTSDVTQTFTSYVRIVLPCLS